MPPKALLRIFFITISNSSNAANYSTIESKMKTKMKRKRYQNEKGSEISIESFGFLGEWTQECVRMGQRAVFGFVSGGTSGERSLEE